MRLLSFLVLAVLRVSSPSAHGETLAEIASFTERVQSLAAKDVMLYSSADDVYLLRASRLRSYPVEKQFYFWRHGSPEVAMPDTVYFWSPDASNFYLLNLLDYNQVVGSLPTAMESIVVDNHELNGAKYARLTPSKGGFELECRGGEAGNKLFLFRPYAQIWKRGSIIAKGKYVPPPSDMLVGEHVLSFQKDKKPHYVVVAYQRFNLKTTTEVRSIASEKRRSFDDVHVFVGEAGKLVDWKKSSDESAGTFDGPNGSIFMNPLLGKISMPNEIEKWKVTLINPDGSGNVFPLKKDENLSYAFLGFKKETPYTRVNKEIFEKLQAILGKDSARFYPHSLPFPCH